MPEELLLHLSNEDSVCVDYTADETIPYCDGIDAVLE